MSAVGGRLRRAAGWLPALVLVPVAVVGVVRVAAVEDVQERFDEVHPLGPGTTWVYAVSDRGEPSGTRTSQVQDRTLLFTTGGVLDASQLTRRYTDYPGLGPRTLTSWLAADGNTLLQPGQVESGRVQQLDPPAPAYVVPADTEADLDYDGALDGSPFAYTSEVTEVGDVEVGGTTFEGCSRWVSTIELDDEDAPGAVEVLEEWTCPGYGPVRSVDTVEAYGTEITEELVAFHGPDREWYAEGQAPATEASLEVAPGGTQAFDAARTGAVPDGELGTGLAWTEAHPGSPVDPPVTDGEHVVVTDLEGQVSVRSTTTGEVSWRVRVTPPVLVTPLVVGDVVVVADGERRVWALSMADGATRWVRELDDVLSSPPTPTDDGIAVVTEAGTLTVLAAGDGSTTWETDLPDPARTPPASTDGLLVVGDLSGTVTAYASDDGEVRWTRSTAGSVVSGPSIAADRVVVGDRSGVLHAYALADGDEVWARAVRDVGEALSVTDDVVVAVNAPDRVSAYALDDGDQRWSRDVEPTSVPPVVVGEEVVLVTRTGALLRLALDDGTRLERRVLPAPDDAARRAGTRFDVAPGLVGDALVVTGQWDSAVSDTVLYAVPLDGAAGGGALLHLDGLELPGSPNEPATTTGEDVVLASAGSLWRLDADGGRTELATSEGLQPGATVRDGTAYVRVGDQLQALDVATGDVAWSVPAGPAYRGTQPAVDEDTVAVGVEGSGVAVLDRATGDLAWSAPVAEEFQVGSPLLLPDGDVVYGGGPLARYEAGSGATLWQAEDAYPFGPPAYGAGLVVAQTQGFASAPRLAAYDASTGAVRWSVEQAGIPSLLGPTLADGVVVSADAAGLVTAHRATDGAELWRLDLGRPLAGPVAVADGRVLLAAAGTGLTVEDRDYRVLALDLRTGRFQAAWEPGYFPSQLARTPVVGASADGRLLAPVAAFLAVVEARP